MTENAPKPSSSPPPPPTARLASVDAYRGLVMFLMMAEVLHLSRVARAFPEVDFWGFLAHHQEHVEWVGCTLHDMIQPSFSFLVGVALPFSIASRLARGQSWFRLSAHAFWRAFALAALGIFLRSMGKPRTYYTFEDTLTQIGLGYGFLYLIGLRPRRDQWIALVVILVGYWGAFVLYTPDSGLDPSQTGVPADWPHQASGLAAHWNKNANLAWAFDRWFLNLFPREKPFAFNGGGYATLSFIPTLATMILGLIAGGVLRDQERGAANKVGLLSLYGLVALGLGWGLGELGLCPVVKRIWTPSWTLFSGGICFLMLAGWYVLVDLARLRPLAFPLIVIGMNSIAAYVMSWTVEGFIKENLYTHFGKDVFKVMGEGHEPLLEGGAILLVMWLVLFWMYRRRIFLRI
ncbi:MAG: acyltransferase family protein [Isosphaeraceae bacterium]